MTRLAIAAAALLLAGCANMLPESRPLPVTPETSMGVRCNDFYEGVADLTAQRRRGNLSDSAWRSLNPYIDSGHKLCQGEATGSALHDLESILETLEVD